jgi:hypothetical protein
MTGQRKYQVASVLKHQTLEMYELKVTNYEAHLRRESQVKFINTKSAFLPS